MPNTKARILVIDDERSIGISCRRILQEEGHLVDTCLSGVEGVRQVLSGDYDLVLLDLNMPDLSGMEALKIIRREAPDVCVIIITGYASIQTSIEAIKKGAFHYVPKPFTPEELALAVSKAMEDRDMRHQNDFLRQELQRLKGDHNILGRSKAIEDIRRQIVKIAPTSFTVTIYGESGTGKELVAHAIHDMGIGPDKPFVPVDISSVSPNLIESELFGHVRGAFTGATSNRPGYFSYANGGTLFLDEIANMSLEVQGKLLRVLENRKVRPVGRELEQDVDVRIIAATNRDLFELVEEGRFREDLYYRLNVIPITLPPLRERPEDIPVLALQFLNKARSESPQSPAEGFTTAAMARFISHEWPGNVRELRNIVERLVATVDATHIDASHLPSAFHDKKLKDPSMLATTIPLSAQDLKEEKKRLKELVFRKVERDFVLAALERSDWNVSRASEEVQMARPNFHALMRKHSIRREDGDDS